MLLQQVYVSFSFWFLEFLLKINQTHKMRSAQKKKSIREILHCAINSRINEPVINQREACPVHLKDILTWLLSDACVDMGLFFLLT